MKLFHYDPETFAFIGTSDARPDPLEHQALVAKAFKAHQASKKTTAFDAKAIVPQKYLQPKFTTPIPPPSVPVGMQAVFINSGWNLTSLPVEEEPEPAKVSWDHVRAQRGALLAASDWTQLGDVPLTPEQKSAWTLYRKSLRDLPMDKGDPAAVQYPIIPTGN